MQKEKSLCPHDGTIWNVLRCALHIIRGKNILYFAFVALCGALQTHFHGRGRRGKRHLHTLPGSPSQAHCVRQLPRRGSFIGTNRQMTKSSPFRGSWQSRKALTERVQPSSCAPFSRRRGVPPKIFPPLQQFPPLNRMQYGKGVGILSGGRGEEQRQTAVFWAAKLCVLLILTVLSQKIRRPAIESTRRAGIIGMLRAPIAPKEGGTVAPGGAAEKR